MSCGYEPQATCSKLRHAPWPPAPSPPATGGPGGAAGSAQAATRRPVPWPRKGPRRRCSSGLRRHSHAREWGVVDGWVNEWVGVWVGGWAARSIDKQGTATSRGVPLFEHVVLTLSWSHHCSFRGPLLAPVRLATPPWLLPLSYLPLARRTSRVLARRLPVAHHDLERVPLLRVRSMLIVSGVSTQELGGREHSSASWA